MACCWRDQQSLMTCTLIACAVEKVSPYAMLCRSSERP